jgi:hypothetical protein
MANISFALYAAAEQCSSVDSVPARLDLPVSFVAERIEAARLCLLIKEDWS